MSDCLKFSLGCCSSCTVCADTFNRPDNTNVNTLCPCGGTTWKTYSTGGTPAQILSGSLKITGTKVSLFGGGLPVNNQFGVEATVQSDTSGDTLRVGFGTDSLFSFTPSVYLEAEIGSNQVKLFSGTKLVWTINTPTPVSTGIVLGLFVGSDQCSSGAPQSDHCFWGAAITGYINGVAMCACPYFGYSQAGSNSLTASSPGRGFVGTGATQTGNCTFSNWSLSYTSLCDNGTCGSSITTAQKCPLPPCPSYGMCMWPLGDPQPAQIQVVVSGETTLPGLNGTYILNSSALSCVSFACVPDGNLDSVCACYGLAGLSVSIGGGWTLQSVGYSASTASSIPRMQVIFKGINPSMSLGPGSVIGYLINYTPADGGNAYVDDPVLNNNNGALSVTNIDATAQAALSA